jgi:hypothetical protein
LAASLLGALLTAGSASSGTTPETFPPPEVFRKLQLTTYACGRDNAASSCEQARIQADPLLDHPRLPASCKDVLWKIRQKAVTASSNSFERRDPIDAAANDVTVFCRQRPKSTTDTKQEKQGQGAGGLRLIEPTAP